MALKQAPIEPRNFIILTVGIVVATLSPTNLISHNNHGYTLAHEERSHHVLDLSLANLLNRFLSCGTFNSVVVTHIVVVAITIPLAIGLIVLVFVADQVIEGKTIVRRDKIDTTERFSASMLVKIGRSTKRVAIAPTIPSSPRQ